MYYHKSVFLKVLYNGRKRILTNFAITNADNFIPKKFLSSRLNFDFSLNLFVLNSVRCRSNEEVYYFKISKYFIYNEISLSTRRWILV